MQALDDNSPCTTMYSPFRHVDENGRLIALEKFVRDKMEQGGWN